MGKKDSKQNILTTILAIAIVALILIIVYIIYNEKVNSSKEEQTNTLEIENTTNDNTISEPEKDKEDDKKDEEKLNNDYIGEEEREPIGEEDTQLTKDEKALQLAKEKWGEDTSVTFNIEEKKENIYYIAVKSNATVISWYEVNTETWTISEFY